MSEDEKIAFIVDILDRGNHVYDWPDDEAAAYREFRFERGTAAVNRLRAQKILAAVSAG